MKFPMDDLACPPFAPIQLNRDASIGVHEQRILRGSLRSDDANRIIVEASV
jgi:hypothetical protein